MVALEKLVLDRGLYAKQVERVGVGARDRMGSGLGGPARVMPSVSAPFRSIRLAQRRSRPRCGRRGPTFEPLCHEDSSPAAGDGFAQADGVRVTRWVIAYQHGLPPSPHSTRFSGRAMRSNPNAKP